MEEAFVHSGIVFRPVVKVTTDTRPPPPHNGSHDGRLRRAEHPFVFAQEGLSAGYAFALTGKLELALVLFPELLKLIECPQGGKHDAILKQDALGQLDVHRQQRLLLRLHRTGIPSWAEG